MGSLNKSDRIIASIIITTYNSAEFIKKSVEPLLHQMGCNDEMIIVDDGSQDGTSVIIKEMNDPRVNYLWQANSGSPAGPRNLGVKASKGKYVFIFDSDDVPIPEKINACVEALDKNPSAGFIFTNFDMIDESENILFYRYVDRYDSLSALLNNRIGENLYHIAGRALFTNLFKANFIGTSSVAFRRSTWNLTNGFDETFSNLDDRDMWLQLAQKGNALFLDLTLHQYRNHDAGISKKQTRRQIFERIKLAKKYRKHDLDKDQKTQIKKFTGKNYLHLGYEEFHEKNNKFSALNAFLRSFLLSPSLPAFKGVVKSVTPHFIYIFIRN